MKTLKFATFISTAASLLTASTIVIAGPLGTYDAVINKASPACVNLGDAVSCSAPLLNYLSVFSGGPLLSNAATTAAGGYIAPANQGVLQSYIVITAGGATQGNGDTNPAPPAVEDGFKSNDVGSASFLATGKANGTTVVAGNLTDPANNSLTAGADNAGTWDVGLKWLLDALTIGGVRRELTIGFDFNQTQNSTTSLDYWSLITLRDLNGGLTDINFEIRKNPVGSTFNTFNTTKTFASQPNASDFGTVNGITCVDSTNTKVPPILPITGGQCPSGYDVSLNNAQGSNTAEIIAFLPELNANLFNYVSQGYDVASVRLMMGCFGRGSTNAGAGLGYLANDAFGTNNCDSGGFGDVFLMAGAVMPSNVPEPGALALMALALGALGWNARRRSIR